MTECHIDREHYAGTAIRRYGTVPHAGFALGFERTLAYVTGLANVRDAIFPAHAGQRGIDLDAGIQSHAQVRSSRPTSSAAAIFFRVSTAFALAVLDLRQVADADPGARGELAQRVAAMLAPNPDRVLPGDQPVNHADRHAFLAARAMIGSGCRSVLDQIGEVIGGHDHELGAVRIVDELGAGQRGETIAH
jgi:hypothetical protein